MTSGKPFEVSKEVFERAKARGQRGGGYYYMTTEDQRAHFSDSILMGYGLYNCMVHEEDGKYICTWDCGDSCD